MAGDFFERQQQARQRTGLLVFYFFLAVFLTVVAVNLVFFLATRQWAQPGLPFGGWLAQPCAWGVSVATLAVIAGGSLSSWLKLRAGGRVIAETVGARRIDPDTTRQQERVLLNIVEEMAIASGTPAPTTFVMDDEDGINAFVAGFAPTEAVLVVTRGALEHFSRDELQGVVGHEFSHILNGDMRMNVNLYALLSGILAIGRVGEFLLRSRGNARSNNKDGSLLVLIGAALMVIGYVGLFFGRLIKAAISRQREWLADASSVQFTRNPQGIGEALLKIRNHGAGSLLHNAHAEDMSHMCFARPVTLRLASLLATHPPLDERIRAIDPALLARDRARTHASRLAAGDETAAATVGSAAARVAPAAPGRPHAGSAGFAAAAPATDTAATAAALLASVGAPGAEHLQAASRLRAGIPDPVRDALRTPAGARVIVYGIVLAGTERRHDDQARRLIGEGDSPGIANRVQAVLPELRRAGARTFLPCLDLALPALREMSGDQKRKFVAVLASLTQLDQRITLREYLVLSMMRRHLGENAGATRPVRNRSYASVAGPVNTLVSLLCHAAGGDDAARAGLHAREIRAFGLGREAPALLPAEAVGTAQLNAALGELADLSPLLKKPLLDACIDCVGRDGKLQVAEIELVRIIGDALDCPVPPWAGAAAASGMPDGRAAAGPASWHCL